MCKILIFLFLLFLPSFSFAQEAVAAVRFMSEDELAGHKKTITRIEKYLSGISSITSDFIQVAPDGSLSSGKFFLERPNRMRWQYNPPTPILMVANGSELIYYDYELEQISHIPLDSTLIGFLAQEKISFDNSVGVFLFSETAGNINIGIAQRARPNDGRLVLEFSDKPLLIRKMVVTDTNGQVTTVSLNKASFDLKIDKNLFEFKDPRKPRRR